MRLGIGPNPHFEWPFEKSSNSYFVNFVLYNNKSIKLHL